MTKQQNNIFFIEHTFALVASSMGKTRQDITKNNKPTRFSINKSRFWENTFGKIKQKQQNNKFCIELTKLLEGSIMDKTRKQQQQQHFFNKNMQILTGHV